MDLNNLHEKLIAAARTVPPEDRVPYAFEKRIMARIRAGVRVDWLSEWNAALWRAAGTCLGIVAISATVLLWSPSHDNGDDFSNEFAIAVFASAGSVDDVQ